jgi:hypothetical protein
MHQTRVLEILLAQLIGRRWDAFKLGLENFIFFQF